MTARIVNTDLDGTMVGPRGSFWHTASRELTDDPATALLELHRSGVPLVLVSGRTHEQVVEPARIFAADGAIAELGATISWDAGRSLQRQRGELPEEFGDRTPMDVMAELGVVEMLIADHPGRLEWSKDPLLPAPRKLGAGPWRGPRSPSTPGSPSATWAG